MVCPRRIFELKNGAEIMDSSAIGDLARGFTIAGPVRLPPGHRGMAQNAANDDRSQRYPLVLPSGKLT